MLYGLIYGGPLQFSDSFNAQQGLSHVIYKRGGKRSPQRLYVRYNFVTVAAVDSVDGASSKVPCSLGSLVDTIWTKCGQARGGQSGHTSGRSHFSWAAHCDLLQRIRPRHYRVTTLPSLLCLHQFWIGSMSHLFEYSFLQVWINDIFKRDFPRAQVDFYFSLAKVCFSCL